MNNNVSFRRGTLCKTDSMYGIIISNTNYNSSNGCVCIVVLEVADQNTMRKALYKYDIFGKKYKFTGSIKFINKSKLTVVSYMNTQDMRELDSILADFLGMIPTVVEAEKITEISVEETTSMDNNDLSEYNDNPIVKDARSYISLLEDMVRRIKEVSYCIDNPKSIFSNEVPLSFEEKELLTKSVTNQLVMQKSHIEDTLSAIMYNESFSKEEDYQERLPEKFIVDMVDTKKEVEVKRRKFMLRYIDENDDHIKNGQYHIIPGLYKDNPFDKYIKTECHFSNMTADAILHRYLKYNDSTKIISKSMKIPITKVEYIVYQEARRKGLGKTARRKSLEKK